jgi:hypothetical protein
MPANIRAFWNKAEAAAEIRSIDQGETVEVIMRPPSLLPLPKNVFASERLQGVRHRPGPKKKGAGDRSQTGNLPRKPMLHRSINCSVLIYIDIVNMEAKTRGIWCCIAATKLRQTSPVHHHPGLIFPACRLPVKQP